MNNFNIPIDMNAITGSPVDNLDEDSSSIFTNHADLGEFLDDTIVISPNNLLNAMCGNLTEE